MLFAAKFVRARMWCVCVSWVGRGSVVGDADLFGSWVTRRWVVGEIWARSAAFFEVMVGLRVSRSWVVGSVLARSAYFLASWVGRRWIAGKILVRSAAYFGVARVGWSRLGHRRVAGGSWAVRVCCLWPWLHARICGYGWVAGRS